MSELIFQSEFLNAVLDGRQDVTCDDIYDLLCENFTHQDTNAEKKTTKIPVYAPKASSELFEAACALQSMYKSTITTFSKKAFLNVVNLCRDICSYCTYKAEPGQSKATMMSRQTIDDSLYMASKYGCIEALLVTGERPEERYQQAKRWLEENNFESTVDCLVYASEQALKLGLFPHTNAGNLRRSELAQLQKTNVSMGLMLETDSTRLSEPGMAHHLAPSKRPTERIAVLEEAGRLKIPMTTGLLLGIGETIKETIASLDTIRKLHKKYGHIQEVILQNFQPKPDTAMRNTPPANHRYIMMIVAACRIMMPKMNIQIPPNLSPDSYRDFLAVGINDWGGISPLTPDFVNPEFPWPAIDKLQSDTKSAGRTLECRFPVYPEFAHMVSTDLRMQMSEIAQSQDIMLVKKEVWQ